jgi:hypothetical protein
MKLLAIVGLQAIFVFGWENISAYLLTFRTSIPKKSNKAIAEIPANFAMV